MVRSASDCRTEALSNAYLGRLCLQGLRGQGMGRLPFLGVWLACCHVGFHHAQQDLGLEERLCELWVLHQDLASLHGYWLL